MKIVEGSVNQEGLDDDQMERHVALPERSYVTNRGRIYSNGRRKRSSK